MFCANGSHSHTAGLTLDIVYGIDIAPKNDPYVAGVEVGLDGVKTVCKPGAFLVDMIPWLKYVPAWVPGAGFQRKAEIWKDAQRRAVDDTYDAFKKDLVSDAHMLTSNNSYIEVPGEWLD